ncbi:pentapeptide repeat-containing protein [Sorangium sp. So ce185]|uniref:pentapeptide repeat-containing protein n=1 Tax=Sorangium sp. So ce185 TaxID=3133287 RepID=UPI003F5E8B1A
MSCHQADGLRLRGRGRRPGRGADLGGAGLGGARFGGARFGGARFGGARFGGASLGRARCAAAAAPGAPRGRGALRGARDGDGARHRAAPGAAAKLVRRDARGRRRGARRRPPRAGGADVQGTPGGCVLGRPAGRLRGSAARDGRAPDCAARRRGGAGARAAPRRCGGAGAAARRSAPRPRVRGAAEHGRSAPPTAHDRFGRAEERDLLSGAGEPAGLWLRGVRSPSHRARGSGQLCPERVHMKAGRREEH